MFNFNFTSAGFAMGKRGWMFQRIYLCRKFLDKANNKKVRAMRFDCFYFLLYSPITIQSSFDLLYTAYKACGQFENTIISISTEIRSMRCRLFNIRMIRSIHKWFDALVFSSLKTMVEFDSVGQIIVYSLCFRSLTQMFRSLLDDHFGIYENGIYFARAIP